MTTKDWRKAFKQLRGKPGKMQKYLKHNSPKERATGQGKIRCRRCGRYGAHIGLYSLDLCRTCFRDIALKIGFKKLN